jgi:hypothetical protein
MRFIKKEPIYPQEGEKQIETWFAIWPVTIDNETRVFEKVSVEYRYWGGYGAFAEPCWNKTRFINE